MVYRLLLIGIVMAMIQCTQATLDEKKPVPTSDGSISTEKKIGIPDPANYRDTLLLGTWYYSFPFFSAKLILNRDSTFAYTTRGCTGYTHTAGYWIDKNERIYLVSEEKYKQPFETPIISMPTIEEAENSIAYDSIAVDSTRTFFLKIPAFRPVFNSVTYTNPDTTYTYFDHQPIVIIGDTLFFQSENGSYTTTRFSK